MVLGDSPNGAGRASTQAHFCCALPLPGYGTLPLVTSSVSKIPKDHTSDLIVNLPYRAASGAVHLMGNFAPAGRTPGYLSGREHGAGCGAGKEEQVEVLSWDQVQRRGWEAGETGHRPGLSSCGVCFWLCDLKQVPSKGWAWRPLKVLAFRTWIYKPIERHRFGLEVALTCDLGNYIFFLLLSNKVIF